MDQLGNHNKVRSDEERLAYVVKNIIVPEAIPDLILGLEALLKVHTNTNELVKQNGNKLNDVLLEKDVLRTYVLALMVELGEFIQTMDWKPWRVKTRATDEIILDEFADILAFIGVLLTILNANGLRPKAVAEAYGKKEHVNVARFLEKLGEIK